MRWHFPLPSYHLLPRRCCNCYPRKRGGRCHCGAREQGAREGKFAGFFWHFVLVSIMFIRRLSRSHLHLEVLAPRACDVEQTIVETPHRLVSALREVCCGHIFGLPRRLPFRLLGLMRSGHTLLLLGRVCSGNGLLAKKQRDYITGCTTLRQVKADTPADHVDRTHLLSLI